MRCPDCNKFVSFDEPVVEVQDSSVDGTSVTGSVRITLNCGDCGTELKEAELEFSLGIEHDCDKCSADEEPTFELEEDVDATSTERYETVDKNGKPIKNPRYQKHYYGADLACKVKCDKCGEVIDISGMVEDQASAFNELV